MKTAVATLILGLCGISALGAGIPVSFNFEFEEGIPVGTLLYDLDGNSLSSDIESYGFSIDQPWVWHYVESEDNHVMASTSWYEPAGKSDDWMVLPALKVEDSDLILSWRAKSNHKSLRDGYSVYISEKGNTPQDFDTSNPVFRTEAEDNKWVTHQVSLNEHKGKTIWIAFVNDSEDCAVLWIDGIAATTPQNAAISLTTSLLQRPSEPIKLTGTVCSTTSVPLEKFTLGWRIGSREGSCECDASEEEGNVYKMDIDTGITLEAGEDTDLEVWTLCDELKSSVTQKIFPRYKRMLAEEGTGTWCQYCIRGIVYSEYLRETYPESSVVIAYHSDVMTTDYYMDKIGYYIDMMALPAACCNRDKRYECDPGDFFNMYDQIQKDNFDASLDLYVESINDDKFEAHADVIFSKNMVGTDYRLTYQIIENNVHVPDNLEYAQKNGYAGGSKGEMGGFENMPEIIPPDQMYYQEVARGEICDFYGIEGSIPSEISKGISYTHGYTFQLPENVMVPDNCVLVAILLDPDGKAVNCAQAKLPAGTSTGIKHTDSDMVETGRFTFDGIKISSPVKGLNIVTYSDGSTRKELVR